MHFFHENHNIQKFLSLKGKKLNIQYQRNYLIHF
nr:MAG TPA: hypothetical protein [Caudoviricetes sp.]